MSVAFPHNNCIGNEQQTGQYCLILLTANALKRGMPYGRLTAPTDTKGGNL
jgi:hypothetical protein